MNKPEVLIVHHTGGTDANPLADTSNQTAAIIKEWHLKKGWNDIGYNWVIEKSGKIVKGRDESKEGAHTIGMNSKSIGVCIVGNFDATYPTKEQEQSFKTLYKELRSRYSVLTPDKVYPHRKYANKTCYGKHLSDDWAANLARATEEKPEILDGSQSCKEYLQKQNVSYLVKFLDWLFSIIRNK